MLEIDIGKWQIDKIKNEASASPKRLSISITYCILTWIIASQFFAALRFISDTDSLIRER